jgi:RNA polymerase-binding protein DksA
MPAGKAEPAKETGKRAKRAGGARAGSAKTHLSPAELRQFRRMLLDKRRELVGDMTGIEAEALGADRQEVKGDISDHPADAGTDNFEQEFSLGLLESERVLLAEIDEALRRIEDRTYGVCLGTGKPISKARLRARPWAQYGIEYARMVEKGLVRPGDQVVGEEAEEDEEDYDE